MKSASTRIEGLEKTSGGLKQVVIAKGFYEGDHVGKYRVEGVILTKEQAREKYNEADYLIQFVEYVKDWKNTAERGGQ